MNKLTETVAAKAAVAAVEEAYVRRVKE